MSEHSGATGNHGKAGSGPDDATFEPAKAGPAAGLAELFAGAGQAGDDHVVSQGQIEIEALEVVLPNPAQADAFGLFRGEGRGCG